MLKEEILKVILGRDTNLSPREAMKAGITPYTVDEQKNGEIKIEPTIVLTGDQDTNTRRSAYKFSDLNAAQKELYGDQVVVLELQQDGCYKEVIKTNENKSK